VIFLVEGLKGRLRPPIGSSVSETPTPAPDGSTTEFYWPTTGWLSDDGVAAAKACAGK
jgi:hypothetical protein